jgi:hypothetical protein
MSGSGAKVTEGETAWGAFGAMWISCGYHVDMGARNGSKEKEKRKDGNARAPLGRWRRIDDDPNGSAGAEGTRRFRRAFSDA